MKDLGELRKRIDVADDTLLKALSQRMKAVDHILQHKEASGLPLFDEEREDALLASIMRKSADQGLDPQLAEQVIRAVIRYSRDVQAKRVQQKRNPALDRAVRISYQGTQGAYSWLVCRKHFGEGIEAIGYTSFGEAIRALENEDVDLALLPIENVLAGSIYEVYDLLAEGRLHVVGEEILRIDHCLIGLPGVPLEQLTSVLSHPVALQQCTTFLKTLPNAEAQAYTDSAEAVRKVKQDGNPVQAAIASREAARLYGLEVLREGISDHRENFTRFWVISRRPVTVDPRIPSKTSILLVTEHREGALVACLSALAAQGVNLTKLESRPRRGMPWQYQFHLDMEGNLGEERMVRALDDLRSRARVVRILGCYPKADGDERQRPVPIPPRGQTEVQPAAPLSSRSRRRHATRVWVGKQAVGEPDFTLIVSTQLPDEAVPLMEALGALRRAGTQILHLNPPAEGWKAVGNGHVLEAAQAHGIPICCPVFSADEVPLAAQRVDLLQIDGNHMQSFPLLAAAAQSGKAVLLTRALSSTVSELLAAAEFILEEGNQQVILCEQGIRTFESSQGGTLDLAAIPLIKEQTHLPVVVDPSRAVAGAAHLPPVCRAVRAVGADGLIVSVRLNGMEAAGTCLSVEELESCLVVP